METATSVLIALRRIIRATDFNAKALARETGLTTSQLLVLQLLENGATMTIGEVAKHVNLSQATVTIIVDRLEERGFVERKKGQQDRRQVFATLTAHGKEILGHAPKLLQAIFVENFGRLADWEQTYILSAVERVAHLMNAAFLDASPVLDIGAVDRRAEKPREDSTG